MGSGQSCQSTSDYYKRLLKYSTDITSADLPNYIPSGYDKNRGIKNENGIISFNAIPVYEGLAFIKGNCRDNYAEHKADMEKIRREISFDFGGLKYYTGISSRTTIEPDNKTYGEYPTQSNQTPFKLPIGSEYKIYETINQNISLDSRFAGSGKEIPADFICGNCFGGGYMYLYATGMSLDKTCPNFGTISTISTLDRDFYDGDTTKNPNYITPINGQITKNEKGFFVTSDPKFEKRGIYNANQFESKHYFGYANCKYRVSDIVDNITAQHFFLNKVINNKLPNNDEFINPILEKVCIQQTTKECPKDPTTGLPHNSCPKYMSSGKIYNTDKTFKDVCDNWYNNTISPSQKELIILKWCDDNPTSTMCKCIKAHLDPLYNQILLQNKGADRICFWKACVNGNANVDMLITRDIADFRCPDSCMNVTNIQGNVITDAKINLAPQVTSCNTNTQVSKDEDINKNSDVASTDTSATETGGNFLSNLLSQTNVLNNSKITKYNTEDDVTALILIIIGSILLFFVFVSIIYINFFSSSSSVTPPEPNNNKLNNNKIK